MRKHGGTPSRRDKHVTLAAISPPGVPRGRFVGGQQSGLAGCKPPPLFARSLFLFVTGPTPGGTMGRLSTTECTYLPTCSPSCFDPDLLLLAYLWLGLSWIGCISTIKHFLHQKQAAGTLHQQQAAREAQQKHSVEITIKPSRSRGRLSLRTDSNPVPYIQCAEISHI